MYYVTSYTVSTGIFGSVGMYDKEKIDKKLTAYLNALAEKGYKVVSVILLDTDTKDFDYQIILDV